MHKSATAATTCVILITCACDDAFIMKGHVHCTMQKLSPFRHQPCWTLIRVPIYSEIYCVVFVCSLGVNTWQKRLAHFFLLTIHVRELNWIELNWKVEEANQCKLFTSSKSMLLSFSWNKKFHPQCCVSQSRECTHTPTYTYTQSHSFDQKHVVWCTQSSQ